MIVRRLVSLGFGFALLLGTVMSAAAQGEEATRWAFASGELRSNSMAWHGDGVSEHGLYVTLIAHPPNPC